MNFEDLLVVLGLLLFTVDKFKESLGTQQAMGVPLLLFGGDKNVSKVITRKYVAGRAAKEPCRGRTLLVESKKSWNPTRGYAGQDIAFELSY